MTLSFTTTFCFLQTGLGQTELLCGGTLIHTQFVITAGHCLRTSLYSVVLGEHDTSKDDDCDNRGACSDPPVEVRVLSMIYHGSFNQRTIKHQPNDIALLKLAQEVKFTSYVYPICLPLPNFNIRSNQVGEVMTVSGFGRTAENSDPSPVKLKADLKSIANDECQEIYRSHGAKIVDSQVSCVELWH